VTQPTLELADEVTLVAEQDLYIGLVPSPITDSVGAVVTPAYQAGDPVPADVVDEQGWGPGEVTEAVSEP
jgi:hypothetical protein